MLVSLSSAQNQSTENFPFYYRSDSLEQFLIQDQKSCRMDKY